MVKKNYDEIFWIDFWITFKHKTLSDRHNWEGIWHYRQPGENYLLLEWLIDALAEIQYNTYDEYPQNIAAIFSLSEYAHYSSEQRI